MHSQSEFDAEDSERLLADRQATRCLDARQAQDFLNNRLSQTEQEAVALHVSLCERCLRMLEDAELEPEFSAVMREASRQVAAEPDPGQVAVSGRASWRDWLEGRWSRLGIPLGLAAASLGVLLFLPVRHSTPDHITLRTLRSGEDFIPAARPGRPLALTVDLRGIPPSRRLKLDIVGSTGRIYYSGELQNPGEFAEWRVPDGLPAGSYWARVHVADEQNALLREFSLTVQP